MIRKCFVQRTSLHHLWKQAILKGYIDASILMAPELSVHTPTVILCIGRNLSC
uniref:Uncharacterized protein n=1 Tax=Rhizophora mucronata TaxID=61149 RepID=A0A2P2QUX2_RHIMU